jgi:hypothetical protein
MSRYLIVTLAMIGGGNCPCDSQQPALAATLCVTIEQAGCLVVERWRSAGGGSGTSFNYYDPVAQAWKQRWVGLGLILEMQGGLRDGAMILEGPLHYVRDNRTTRLRGTWTALPDGRVRQLFVESTDQGKTWTTWFDGYYTRAPAEPPTGAARH